MAHEACTPPNPNFDPNRPLVWSNPQSTRRSCLHTISDLYICDTPHGLKPGGFFAHACVRASWSSAPSG
jgi:hypothetical protein